MITEDYCSFEVAKLLKEKGFDAECRAAYTNYGKLFTTQIQQYITNALCSRGKLWDCTAPTIQMAMKWLREVHKIHIIAEPCLGEGDEPNLSFNRWFWTILKEEGEYEPIRKIEEFSTYEEAVEAAIKYCLDNLI